MMSFRQGSEIIENHTSCVCQCIVIVWFHAWGFVLLDSASFTDIIGEVGFHISWLSIRVSLIFMVSHWWDMPLMRDAILCIIAETPHIGCPETHRVCFGLSIFIDNKEESLDQEGLCSWLRHIRSYVEWRCHGIWAVLMSVIQRIHRLRKIEFPLHLAHIFILIKG